MYYINLPSENKRWEIPDGVMYSITSKVKNRDIDIINYLSSHKVEGVRLEDYDFNKHVVSNL